MELFEIYKEAEETLYNKGFIVANMEFFENELELIERKDDGKVLIDHLSLSQLQQLANIL